MSCVEVIVVRAPRGNDGGSPLRLHMGLVAVVVLCGQRRAVGWGLRTGKGEQL
jgi:hypothetical protein